jgi:hypothetical protein
MTSSWFHGTALPLSSATIWTTTLCPNNGQACIHWRCRSSAKSCTCGRTIGTVSAPSTTLPMLTGAGNATLRSFSTTHHQHHRHAHLLLHPRNHLRHSRTIHHPHHPHLLAHPRASLASHDYHAARSDTVQSYCAAEPLLHSLANAYRLYTTTHYHEHLAAHPQLADNC